ncbi:MAG: hypothetical protein AAFX50_16000, partial [Acidobacteriota bacterium]
VSNHAPPPPPPPGAPAPPPAASAPPPSYNPNPGGAGGGGNAGLPTWAKIGIGCGCLGLLIVVAGFMVLGWGAKKAVEAVSDPASIAELAIKAHPDFDLVDTDRDAGSITIREKATGKEQTFDFSDIANGNFSMEGSDGEKIEIGAEAGGVKVTDADGNESSMKMEQTGDGEGFRISQSDGSEFTLGGDAKAPGWVPLYPGVEFAGGMSTSSAESASGTIMAEGIAPGMDEVVKWYEETFEKDFGCKPERSTFEMGGNKTVMIACDGDGKSVNATVAGQDGKRVLSLTYQGPPQ